MYAVVPAHIFPEFDQCPLLYILRPDDAHRLQAEKAARYWRAQHARVERKLIAFMAAKSRPVATLANTTTADGASTSFTKAEEEESSETQGTKIAQGLKAMRAAPTMSRDLRCRSTPAPSDRNSIFGRVEDVGPSGGGDKGGGEGDGEGGIDARGTCGHCGNGRTSPDKPAERGNRLGLRLRVGSSGSGGDIDRQLGEEMAALQQSGPTHGGEEQGTVRGAGDARELSSPPRLTFKQRRAVFCAHNFVPTPPPLRASAVGTPAPSTGSPQLMGSLTPRLTYFSSAPGEVARHKPPPDSPQHVGLRAPRVASFSSTAVEAARHNLQRKYPVRRGASARSRSTAAPSTPIPKSSSFSMAANRWNNGAERKSFSRKNESAVSPSEPTAHNAQAHTTSPSLAGKRSKAVLASVISPPVGSPNGLPPLGSSRLRLHAATSSHQPSTPRHHRTGAIPPAPSPTGTEDVCGTPERGSGSTTWSTRTPSVSSPPAFPRRKAQNRAKGTDDSAIMPGPVETSEESHCKRSANVWYGIYEGHKQAESRRGSDSGGTGQPAPTGGGRGLRGSRTSTRSSQRGQPQGAADKRGGGGNDEPRRDSIVASLAMASPQCLSADGSPPLSPAFVRAMSSSSSSMASSVLLDATATSRLPPTVPGTPHATKPLSAVSMTSTSAVISMVTKKTPAASKSTPQQAWTGTALRQKQPGQPQQPAQHQRAAMHRHSRSSEDVLSTPRATAASFASVPCALPPAKEQAWIWGGKGLCYIDSRGGEAGEVRDERYPLPQLILADDWKKRSPGIGPWPLCQQTRESGEDHHGGTREGSAAVVNGGKSHGDGRDNHGGTDTATRGKVVAAVDSPTRDSRVSFGNISAEQSARLRALREDTEHGQSSSQRALAKKSLGNGGISSGPDKEAVKATWEGGKGGVVSRKRVGGRRTSKTNGFNLVVPEKWGFSKK